MPEGSGKALWEKVYNASKSNGDSEEIAAKKAWAALKSAGWKKNDKGEWVKGKSEVQEFSMAVVKAVFDKENQVMRWRAVASDVDADLYDERMSTELFNDFTTRIKSKTPVPEPFNSIICEDSWCGGMPYLSVAHYKSGDGARNVPGKIDEDGIYVDGTRLKAKGILYDNPMGMATFKSLCDDLYSKKSDPNHTPVRVSIGFLDLQHKHTAEGNGGQEYTFTRTDTGQICPLCAQGIGNKIYTQGQLVHLAMTRVPVNPRTAMEVDKSMDGIITKKDDAKSIIGDLADELEEKSQADDVLVIKADGTTSMPKPDEDKYDACYDPNTDSYDQECVDNLLMGNSVDMRKEMTPAKSMTKGEAWGDESSSSYLVVDDPKHPTTWHLPVKKNGKLDRGLMGRAWAELTTGGRSGKGYQGPQKAKALAKLRSLYKAHGFDIPGEEKKSDVVEESMELGGKNVEEKKFEYEGVHGDPRQDMKKEPMKAKPKDEEEGETPEEEKKESPEKEQEEEKQGKEKKAKALTAAFNAFKSTVLDTDSVDEINAAFSEFGKKVEKSLAPEPAPMDMNNLSEVIKSAVEAAVTPLRMEIAQLKAGNVVQKSNIPAPRSLTLRPEDMLLKSAATQAPKRQLTQIEKIARSSVGLNVE